MRKLFLYIFAGLIFCSIGNTNDIYEFEIEGISIGDSLLEHLSEKEIIKEIEVNSPFYNYYSKYFLVKDYIFNIVKNPPCYGIVNFLKDYNHYFIKLNGDFCHGYSNDRVEYTESSEDESSSGSESESESENKFD